MYFTVYRVNVPGGKYLLKDFTVYRVNVSGVKYLFMYFKFTEYMYLV